MHTKRNLVLLVFSIGWAREAVCFDALVDNPSAMCPDTYSSIPGNRNWQIETADWNLDVRLDILGFRVKKLYARLEILLRNWLAGSQTVVSISWDAIVCQWRARSQH